MTSFFRQTVFALFLAGWGTVSGAFAADRIPVFVTIVPQAGVVQEIGGDRVMVQVLVEPGADPHTYEPKPRQMAQLSQAALYFAIGIEMEKAKLDKITRMNPKLTVIHTDQGIL
ncbi:zinc ABC transporter substrate-binding protein, partial [Desulfosarcina sp. OttesenSCG-928-B08]|nr:zinc ABC transporter substrate-binding protein [Desulfosarcina sp. OttesenSCG-928-B08]